ncbi:hypothetical protein [Rhodopseudomonas sp. BR0G17]|uniref:hypothetical protein n=1 Tax=Rhodopseudomonas sp. BR0G17 TaxID=2269368 RepID=UPI001968233F|nr:hypothetical protein [Rhodopseudomonas sp. BR0G17]
MTHKQIDWRYYGGSRFYLVEGTARRFPGSPSADLDRSHAAVDRRDVQLVRRSSRVQRLGKRDSESV